MWHPTIAIVSQIVIVIFKLLFSSKFIATVQG